MNQAEDAFEDARNRESQETGLLEKWMELEALELGPMDIFQKTNKSALIHLNHTIYKRIQKT